MLVSAQVDRGFRNIDYDPRALRKPLRAAGNEVRKWQERSLPGEPFQRPGNTRASRQAACRDRSACGFLVPGMRRWSRRRRRARCRSITRLLSSTGIGGRIRKPKHRPAGIRSARAKRWRLRAGTSSRMPQSRRPPTSRGPWRTLWLMQLNRG